MIHDWCARSTQMLITLWLDRYLLNMVPRSPLCSIAAVIMMW